MGIAPMEARTMQTGSEITKIAIPMMRRIEFMSGRYQAEMGESSLGNP